MNWITNTARHQVFLVAVIVWLVLLGGACFGEDSTPFAAVVIGPQAPELERFASDQLAGYLKKLYAIRTQPANIVPPDAETILLVGSPATNPAVAESLADGTWPELSDQGLAIIPCRVAGKPAVVLGGGSPQATLWAVYELVERWGVRYLLHGDVLPEDPGPLILPSEPIVMEPEFRVRQWRVVNDFACGPESWGMADYRPVLDQLAKLKFNRILVCIYTWQPFLHLEVDGVARREAWLWYQQRYPITDDMPGRHLFGDSGEFWNPDLPQNASYSEFAAAGEKHLHALMAYARLRGMQSVLTAGVTAFPHEFKDFFHGAKALSGWSRYTMVPGPETPIDDPGLKKLATAVLQTSVNTYPEVDYLQVGVTEVRKWSGEYERAWRALDEKYQLSNVRTLEEILEKARRRKGYPGGPDRAVAEVKADIAAIYFLDQLIGKTDVFRNTERSDVKLIYYSLAEELYPLLARILPPGSGTLNFVDYTPTRIIRRKETLAVLGGKDIPALLYYTLHDDNVGVLPHLSTGSLHQLTQELLEHDWAGFCTRYWLISDHDLCLAYLARVSWNAATTPDAVYADLLEHVCGRPAVADLTLALAQLEETSRYVEDNLLGFAFPVPGMNRHHRVAGAMPEEFIKVRNGYRRALAAVRRARTETNLSGRSFVDYWIGRLEFGIGYFDCIEAGREAMVLKAAARRAQQAGEAGLAKAKHAEAADAMRRTVEICRVMLECYARVAQDQSDRGAIATMAEYVYRPLKAQAEDWSAQ